MKTTPARRRTAFVTSTAFAVGILASLTTWQPATASAQAGSVAFTSFRSGAAQVYAVNADGSGLRALTGSRGAFEGSPAFSADGRRIAYTCGNFELCVMNADGSGQTRVTTNDWPREFRYDTAPSWSPDGTRLVFVRTVGGSDQIWIVNVDGSSLRQVPVPAGVNGDPSFSPDARTIVFEHADIESEDGDLAMSSDSGIYVVGADGSALRSLTGPGRSASDPAWAPDGRSIAFIRSTDESSRIFVMNADGSSPRRVSPRAIYAADPAFSPDGGTIVFASVRRSGLLLYKVPAGGGAATALTTGRGTDFDPAWQSTDTSDPAHQLPPPGAAPSDATADARVVGVLLRAIAELGVAFGGVGDLSGDRRTAARIDRYARRISAAARSLQPVTQRGRRVRARVLQSMRALKASATAMRRLSGSSRHRDRRASRRHREAVLGGIFGAGLLLADGAGIAGTSQATL